MVISALLNTRMNWFIIVFCGIILYFFVFWVIVDSDIGWYVCHFGFSIVPLVCCILIH